MANLEASSNAGERFHNFLLGWVSEECQLLSELTIASKSHRNNYDVQLLSPLVNRCMSHCELYIQAKSQVYGEDVVASFNPKGKSTLHTVYGWIGGWRPRMAIELLYSKCSLQFEARFAEVMHGIPTFDLGDLSTSQIIDVEGLKTEIINEEIEISQMRAECQYSVVDSPMVDLSHAFVEVIDDSDRVGNMDERVKSILRLKRAEMEELVRRADDLRMRTIRSLVQILTPLQSVHFFIAAAELHLTYLEF